MTGISKGLVAIVQLAGELPPENEILFVLLDQDGITDKTLTAQEVLDKDAAGTLAAEFPLTIVPGEIEVDINPALERVRDYFISRGTNLPSFLLVTTEEEYTVIEYGPTGTATNVVDAEPLVCGDPWLPFQVESFTALVGGDGILRRGDTLELTATVRNLGNKPARAFGRFYYTNGSVIDSNATLIGTNGSTFEIEPGETDKVIGTWAYVDTPAFFAEDTLNALPDGTYLFGVAVGLFGGPATYVPCCLGTANVPIEIDKPRPPRPAVLNASNLSISPTFWDTNTQVVIRFRVTNSGQAKSPAVNAQITAFPRSTIGFGKAGARTFENLPIPPIEPGEFQEFRISFGAIDAAPFLPVTGSILQAVNDKIDLSYDITVTVDNANFGGDTPSASQRIVVSKSLDQVIRNTSANETGGTVTNPPDDDTLPAGSDLVVTNFRLTDQIPDGNFAHDYYYRFVAYNGGASAETNTTWALWSSDTAGGTKAKLTADNTITEIPAETGVTLTGSVNIEIADTPEYVEVRLNDDAATSSAEVLFNAQPEAPTIVNDFATTDEDQPVEVDVVANDPAGVEVLTVSAPANGTAEIVNGKILYTPNAGFAGEDSFTYTAGNEDGQGSGTVTITVVGALPDLSVVFNSANKTESVVINSQTYTEYAVTFTVENTGGSPANNVEWAIFEGDSATDFSGTIATVGASDSEVVTTTFRRIIDAPEQDYTIRLTGDSSKVSNVISLGPVEVTGEYGITMRYQSMSPLIWDSNPEEVTVTIRITNNGTIDLPSGGTFNVINRDDITLATGLPIPAIASGDFVDETYTFSADLSNLVNEVNRLFFRAEYPAGSGFVPELGVVALGVSTAEIGVTGGLPLSLNISAPTISSWANQALSVSWTVENTTGAKTPVLDAFLQYRQIGDWRYVSGTGNNVGFLLGDKDYTIDTGGVRNFSGTGTLGGTLSASFRVQIISKNGRGETIYLTGPETTASPS